MTEPFIVKHYAGDDRPILKGNGFDGLEVGDDRQDAEDFVAWVNAKLARLAEAEAAITDARANLGALSPDCFKAAQWIGDKAQATWVALDNYHFKHLRAAVSAEPREDVGNG